MTNNSYTKCFPLIHIGRRLYFENCFRRQSRIDLNFLFCVSFRNYANFLRHVSGDQFFFSLSSYVADISARHVCKTIKDDISSLPFFWMAHESCRNVCYNKLICISFCFPRQTFYTSQQAKNTRLSLLKTFPCKKNFLHTGLQAHGVAEEIENYILFNMQRTIPKDKAE